MIKIASTTISRATLLAAKVPAVFDDTWMVRMHHLPATSASTLCPALVKALSMRPTQGLKEAMSTQNTIYSMFAGVGNRIVSITHRMHTNPERRAAVVRWVTESCRPIKIVEDRKLREIVLAGRPQAQFSHRRELAQDIDTAFTVCSERIAKILKLSFATDCWTSPNHRAFCAWTVHLQHQAREFDKMLQRHGLGDKILGFTGDNATSNDTQTTALDISKENQFTKEGRVRCFNHTMNLAAKALINGVMDDKVEGVDPFPDEIVMENEDEIPPLEDFVDMDDEDGEFGQDEIDNNESDEDASGEIELTRFALTKVFEFLFFRSCIDLIQQLIIDPRSLFCNHSLPNYWAS
ncbi:hypothetical protein K435DRAFT_502649 [Dendrothele bispora CBS 962.96]|uniref:HAT C-terminal dimerisation domain-containing protein n=1 Tax=Dendrothele bispora (strain CBS 962.96) TaxID=1314807 RepID=A0A4V4HGL1_DENBC|nr:hypothetical protein K435DRAFT_502649 [Dendrothele bispora CBS 962.96]